MSEARDAAEWDPIKAEDLIRSLTGVLSARVVTNHADQVEEVHVLTTEAVSPKQTVRNVESALQAHFEIDVDHRKISVARTDSLPEMAAPAAESVVSLVMDQDEEEGEQHEPVDHSPRPAPGDGHPGNGPRIVYQSHRTETENANRVRITVVLSYEGTDYEGHAVSANLPRPRLEAASNATLRAVETLASAEVEGLDDPGERPVVALALDGVKVVEAFEREFALVAVHALAGRDIVALAGASVVKDRTDASVIMATLQATDRWVRGRMI